MLGVLCAPPAFGIYLLSPWETQVLQADLIGIVECETAGSPVAGFRVVESWKGPKPGTRITLSIFTGEFGNEFDGALCGDRYLLMAGRVQKRAETSSSDPYLAPDPSRGWQGLPIDYGVSFSMAKLPLRSYPEEDDPRPLSSFGSDRQTVAEFKRDVLDLLAANPADRDFKLAKKAFVAGVRLAYADGRRSEFQLRDPLLAHFRFVEQAGSMEELASRLLCFRPQVDPRWDDVASESLAKCGLPALRQILALPPEEYPLGADSQSRLLEELLDKTSPVDLPANWYPRVTPEQEANTLRALTERSAEWRPNRGLPLEDARELRRLAQRLKPLTSPEKMVDCLEETAAKSERLRWAVRRIASSGAQATLRRLESAPGEPPAEADHAAQQAALCIRRRLGFPLPNDHPQPPFEIRFPDSTPSHLSTWRRLLSEPATSGAGDYEQAIVAFAGTDPEVPVEFLLGLPEVGSASSPLPRHHRAVASVFASHCTTNREAHLRRLLSAPHSAIRVGAAVNLCFDDPVAGKAALHGMTGLPGEDGTWAAVTLARWGEKEAVERALHGVFDSEPAYHDGPFRGYLRWQLLALLSNSASAGGLPRPEEPYLKWWNEHRERIVLVDPWLALYRGVQ